VIGGNLVKILAWYDNEWGFSNRLVDLAKKWHNADCNNIRRTKPRCGVVFFVLTIRT
jgi:hypothetical protein